MCVLKLSIAPYSDTPFHFVETGINVYSFEELLFHCYHYWKESLNELENGSVSAWVKDVLGLAFLSARIDKILARDAMLSEKYLDFLGLEDYFDREDLELLEHDIIAWENKTELEKLKQQGDERLSENDYEKAAFYYNKLLAYGESAAIYNNIGCCFMKTGMLAEAEKSLRRAAALDKRNSGIKLNTVTLYLLQNREAEAERLLSALEKSDNDRYVQYYLGDLEHRRNNIKKAIEYYTRSANMGNTLEANAALCKIAIKSRDYVAAMEYAEKIPDKTSSHYLESMAKVYYAKGDRENALKNVEGLLAKNANEAGYWALAARLYREKGELNKAVSAVEKAMEIDSANEEAVFEYAKIKKALGKTIEYQELLVKIVDKWKAVFRLSS